MRNEKDRITLEEILKKNPPGDFIIWLFRFLPDRKELGSQYDIRILLTECRRATIIGPEQNHPYIKWIYRNLLEWDKMRCRNCCRMNINSVAKKLKNEGMEKADCTRKGKYIKKNGKICKFFEFM